MFEVGWVGGALYINLSPLWGRSSIQSDDCGSKNVPQHIGLKGSRKDEESFIGQWSFLVESIKVRLPGEVQNGGF